MTRRANLPWIAAAVLLCAGCAGNQSASTTDDTQNVVDVTAQGLTFQAPDSIASGWATFRFHNESGMTHFALLERMPEGIGIREHQEQAAPIFQAGMDLMNAGKMDAAMKEFGKLPEWFGQIVFMGGPGLTGPGHTSEASIHLEPGTYVLECYVKTDGTFHSFNRDSGAYGMVHQFTVTVPASSALEPQADWSLTLSSEHGISTEGQPRVGRQTVAVHFADQATYANFGGHDAHLVRLTEGTDMNALVAWMDWTQKTGLQTPAPVEFLGGLNDMPAGSTGYVTVTLDPGRYAWIAEVPKADDKGLLHVFTVPEESASPS